MDKCIGHQCLLYIVNIISDIKLSTMKHKIKKYNEISNIYFIVVSLIRFV